MPTGDIMRATIEGTFDGEPVIVGLGFISNSGAATWEDDAAGLAGSLVTNLELNSSVGSYLSPLSEHYLVTGVRVQDMSPGLSAGILVATTGAGGNAIDDALPPQNSLVVTWRTGLKGKENRGRSYLTGFAEDAQNQGVWGPEILNWADVNFAGHLLTLYGPFGTENYSLALIHTVSGGARLVPPTATPITSNSVHREVRTQRRRGVGVRISRRPRTP